MKLLVCHEQHQEDSATNETFKELMNYVEDVEFMHAYCEGLMDHGPHVITFPEVQFYSRVTSDKVSDLIHGTLDGHKLSIEQLYHPEMEVYRSDPMHRRSVKLFRYQLEKMTEHNWQSLREVLPIFCDKYDVDHSDLSRAVRMAIIGTTKGPDLPKLIVSLGIEETYNRIDQYLADNKYRI